MRPRPAHRDGTPEEGGDAASFRRLPKPSGRYRTAARCSRPGLPSPSAATGARCAPPRDRSGVTSGAAVPDGPPNACPGR